MRDNDCAFRRRYSLCLVFEKKNLKILDKQARCSHACVTMRVRRTRIATTATVGSENEDAAYMSPRDGKDYETE